MFSHWSSHHGSLYIFSGLYKCYIDDLLPIAELLVFHTKPQKLFLLILSLSVSLPPQYHRLYLLPVLISALVTLVFVDTIQSRCQHFVLLRTEMLVACRYARLRCSESVFVSFFIFCLSSPVRFPVRLEFA